MPTCSNCGRENQEGYRFCQGCGTPLASNRPPSREVAQVQTCATCGNANGPGMKFCSNCGTPLAAPPAGKPSNVTCPSCGGQTPYGFSFCQQCGTPLAGAQKAEAGVPPPAQPPVAKPPGPPPAVAAQQVATVADVSPTPPAGMAPQSDPRIAAAVLPTEPPAKPAAAAPPAAKPAAAPVEPPPAAATPPEAEPPAADEPESAAEAAQPAPAAEAALEVALGLEKGPRGAAAVGGATVGPGARRPASEERPERAVLARLVSVRRDGSDGETHEITEEAVDLGRDEGQLTFPDDPYLSERHCRFALQDGAWVVQDLVSRNGVYLRISEAVELSDGDMILLGKQVLRFDLLSEAERHLAPAVEHGVTLLGSPLREPWGRLRQITVAGVSRDIYYLYRPKVTIGREDGDLIFPDDEFMSRQHLALSLSNGKVQLKDVGSSNGTFVRIRDQPRLKHREMLRVGDQLLRFELA